MYLSKSRKGKTFSFKPNVYYKEGNKIAKIRAERNEMDTKKTTEKISKT